MQGGRPPAVERALQPCSGDQGASNWAYDSRLTSLSSRSRTHVARLHRLGALRGPRMQNHPHATPGSAAAGPRRTAQVSGGRRRPPPACLHPCCGPFPCSLMSLLRGSRAAAMVWPMLAGNQPVASAQPGGLHGRSAAGEPCEPQRSPRAAAAAAAAAAGRRSWRRRCTAGTRCRCPACRRSWRRPWRARTMSWRRSCATRCSEAGRGGEHGGRCACCAAPAGLRPALLCRPRACRRVACILSAACGRPPAPAGGAALMPGWQWRRPTSASTPPSRWGRPGHCWCRVRPVQVAPCGSTADIAGNAAAATTLSRARTPVLPFPCRAAAWRQWGRCGARASTSSAYTRRAAASRGAKP